MSSDDTPPDQEQDQDLDRQMEQLAQQLTDEKVKVIAERLGLHRHEAATRHPVTRDPTSRNDFAPGISNNEDAHCSFCGGSRESVGIMVESKKGALICRGCIGAMVAGKTNN